MAERLHYFGLDPSVNISFEACGCDPSCPASSPCPNATPLSAKSTHPTSPASSTLSLPTDSATYTPAAATSSQIPLSLQHSHTHVPPSRTTSANPTHVDPNLQPHNMPTQNTLSQAQLHMLPGGVDVGRLPASASERSALHAHQMQLWCDEAWRRRGAMQNALYDSVLSSGSTSIPDVVTPGIASPPRRIRTTTSMPQLPRVCATQQHVNTQMYPPTHAQTALAAGTGQGQSALQSPPAVTVANASALRRSLSNKSLRIRMTPSSSSRSLMSDVDSDAGTRLSSVSACERPVFVSNTLPMATFPRSRSHQVSSAASSFTSVSASAISSPNHTLSRGSASPPTTNNHASTLSTPQSGPLPYTHVQATAEGHSSAGAVSSSPSPFVPQPYVPPADEDAFTDIDLPPAVPLGIHPSSSHQQNTYHPPVTPTSSESTTLASSLTYTASTTTEAPPPVHAWRRSRRISGRLDESNAATSFPTNQHARFAKRRSMFGFLTRKKPQ